MAKKILIGTTDRTVLVFIPDPASTTGTGKTGLTGASFTVSNTRVEVDNDVIVTDYTASLTTLSALTDAHTDWGMKEVSATLAPGLYRLDLADAVFASGAWYSVVFVCITSGLAAASPIEFQLVAYNELDGAALGLTLVPANVTQLGGVAQSLTDLKDFADDGYDPSTNKVQGVVLVDTLTTYTGNTPQTGDVFPLASTEIADIKAKTDNLPSDPADESLIIAATDAIMARLGAPAGISMSADIAEIESQTDDIGIAGAGLTAVPWNAAWDAEIQSEVDDALVAQRLDELLNADSDIDGAAPPTVGSVFHELMTKTAGSFTFDQTTDSLEAIRDRGDAAWITGAGGDPWTTALPGAYGAGTAGFILGTNIDALISSRAAADTALTNVTWTDARASKLDNLDAAVTTRMATYTQPTGFLTATFPTDPADQSLVIAATDAIISTLSTLSSHGDSAWATAVGFAVPGDQMDLVSAPNIAARNVIADIVNTRSYEFAEGSISKFSNAGLGLFAMNWYISGGNIVSKKISDDSDLFTYSYTTSAGAEPIISVDG